MPRVKLFDENDVLEKAMDLFWKQGYYATSIQDLVNHLGINRASLYDTFGGKKDLFDKVFHLYREKNSVGLRTFLNAHHDVRVGFRQLFLRAIDEAISDHNNKGCFVVNTTIEFIPNDSEMMKVLQDNKTKFEKILFDYLKHGVDQNQISKDKNLKVIASLFYTFNNGLRVVTKVNFDKKQFIASVDELLGVLD